MAKVTIQVLEGLERGHVFRDIPTPFTIGREEGNAVQLNDERVSRFHAKVQEDSGQLILTDLESTNGTRVNGHPVKMRILRIGDQISVGRCLLLVGSREQLEQLRQSSSPGASAGASPSAVAGIVETGAASSPEEAGPAGIRAVPDVEDLHTTGSAAPAQPMPASELFPHGPPPLPPSLSPLQQAQLSDVLQFIHANILRVLQHGQERREVDAENDRERRYFAVPPDTWRRLAQLEYDLAVYLETIADPSFRA